MIKFRKRIDFVIELSSSSVKLFDRSGINNVTYRTGTSDLVYNKIINLIDYKKFVLPYIKSCLNIIKSSNYIIIATALYRNLKNSNEIIKLIEDEIGQKVNIISGEEESRLVSLAVKKEYPELKRILIIDAGFNSTELGLIPENIFISLPVGFDKPGYIQLGEVFHKLKDDKDLILVVTGKRIQKMGYIKDPVNSLKSHTILQRILKIIGNHPVIGTTASPGLGCF